MSHARVDAEGDEADHIYPEVPDAGTPLALQRAQPAVKAPSQARRPRKSKTPLPPLFVVVISALLGLSVLAGWGFAYLFVFSSVQEHRAQHVLQATLRSRVAEGTEPITGKIASGVPVAVLSIPRLGLHEVAVVEGTTSTNLEAGPGHRRDTPLPGEQGASFILGRSVTFGAPFADLTKLKAGDAINVQTGEGKFSFTVDAVRRPGDSLTPFDTAAARLTLVTSEATRGGARQVVYVDATTSTNVKDPNSGRPPAVPTSEEQLKGDRGGLGQAVLWLLGLVVAAVGLSWTRVRWGLRPTLIVAVPVLAAAAWGVAESLSHLLPNLY
jgi:sortase A